MPIQIKMIFTTIIAELSKFITILIILLSATICRAADNLPEGLSFIGLNSSGVWQIYLIVNEGSEPQPIITLYEPRTHTISLRTSKAAYIGADRTLREFNLIIPSNSFDKNDEEDKTRDIKKNNEKILLSSDNNKIYIQPVYSRNGDKLFIVEMKAGSSSDTDIMTLSSDENIPELIVNQRSAQFEPFDGTDGFLYFSSVHCTQGCGKTIQEIWRKNIVSGESEQMTLMNAVAREPVVSKDGKWLYFSSDKTGNYNIWRFSFLNKTYESLTYGNVSDTNPVLDKSDNLYFIRYSAQKIQLMLKHKNEMVKEIMLPDFIKEIRDLRINQ